MEQIRSFLILLALIVGVIGGFAYYEAPTAIQQIGAFLLFNITAMLIVGASILAGFEHLKIHLESAQKELTSQNDERQGKLLNELKKLQSSTRPTTEPAPTPEPPQPPDTSKFEEKDPNKRPLWL